MNIKSIFGLTLSAATVIAVGLTGCSSAASSGSSMLAEHSTAADPSTATMKTTHATLDTVFPDDENFFAQFRLPGATSLGPPETLEMAVAEADAVVVARVGGVQKTRELVTDSTRTSFYFAGVELEVTEVLAGKLNQGAPKPIVEFIQSDVESLGRLQSNLPQGESIWFLHWQGENRVDPGKPTSEYDKKYYDLISMQGVLTQSPLGVMSVLDEPEDLSNPPEKTMAKDARKYAKLSLAAAAIKESAH